MRVAPDLRKRLMYGIIGVLLVTVGTVTALAVTSMVSAHGADPTLIHACVNKDDRSIKVAAVNGKGDPNTDCSQLPGTWGALDLDADWSGVGTGRLFPTDPDANVGIGTSNPGARLQVNAPAGSNGLWISAGDALGDVLFHVEDSDGSVQAVHIEDDGFVGIGTTEPEFRLDVAGDGRVERLRVDDQMVIDTSEFMIQVGDISAGEGLRDLGLFAGDVLVATLTTDGNVGIGTDSPTARLQVNAPAGSNGLWISAGDAAGDVLFHVEDSDGSVQAVHIEDDGFVGIGTTEPTRRLDVNGFFRQTNGHMLFKDGLENAVFVVQDGTHPDDLWPNRFVFRSVPDLDAYDASQSTIDVMTIENEGHVGIGTPNPDVALHVEDTSGTTIRIDGTEPDANVFLQMLEVGDAAGIELQYDGTGLGALLINDFGKSTLMTIKRGSGNVGIGTTDPGSWAAAGSFPVMEVNGLLAVSGNDNGSDLSTISSEGGGLPLRLKARGGDFPDLVVAPTGNVGVGTSDPQSRLHVSGYTQLDLTDGAPPAADCDDGSEHGRMKVDATAGVSLLYICTADGWVGK